MRKKPDGSQQSGSSETGEEVGVGCRDGRKETCLIKLMDTEVGEVHFFGRGTAVHVRGRGGGGGTESHQKFF